MLVKNHSSSYQTDKPKFRADSLYTTCGHCTFLAYTGIQIAELRWSVETYALIRYIR